MAEAGANPGPDLDLGDEAKQLRLLSIPEAVAEEDKTDGANVNLLNVSVTLSIRNSGNRVSQDLSQQYVRKQQLHSGLLDQTPAERLRSKRAYSSTLSLLRMLLEVLSLGLCRR